MIKFAGQSLPSYVKVTDIKYSILPSIESKTERVYGRAGSYDFGVEIGDRKIEVEVMLIGANQNDVIKKAREFAAWLYTKDLQPLILLDEPDKQYMARVTGDTDVSELYRTGTATINFLCPSAYAESIVDKTVNWSPVDYTPVNVTNNGSAETYPIVDMTIKQDMPSIALITGEKFVKIGDETVGTTRVDATPLILNDSLDTYTGWGTGISVDGGTITGTLTSNGSAIQQTGKDYGTGTGWHGGAGIKTLSRALTDFRVQARVQLAQATIGEIGRIEIYLLDVNNVIIGKMAIVDSNNTGDFTRVEARAGALSGGKYFVNDFGKQKGVLGKLDGMIQIDRKGRDWFFYVNKLDAKGRYVQQLSRTWTDSKNTYSTKQLAKIQIHIGTYASYVPVSTMLIKDLKVYDRSVNVDPSTQVPILFKAGDTVTIDNQRAIVLKNGLPIFSELDPSSDFFALEKGANGLILSPPFADVVIKYKERWL